MNVIETHGLTKSYGATRAVDSLDMRVTRGDIYGFVGKNGAGKSTTMKMLAGLSTPTAGTMKLFGAEAENTPAFSSAFSRIGALIENPGLLPNFSAFENLMMKALSIGVVNPRAQCVELLELVGLDPASPRKTKKFSLGMKQRLGIALALVGSPDLLLLDEPFNGIDPEETRALRSALMRLNHERGVTMVISSHVLDQLNRMATRFGVIRSGRMVREFTEEELHAACGSSVRVKTTDPARSLAILEEHLPGAAFRVEPDCGIMITGASGARHAAASFGGAASDTAATGAPAAEDVSRVLAAAGQTIIELTVIERDFEEYFVELMGDTVNEPANAERVGATRRGR